MLAPLLLAGLLSLQGAAAAAGQIHPSPPLEKGGGIEAAITAYCLKGQRTTSGKVVYPGCLALSRPLAKALGLKKGPGPYDYRFGVKVVVEGLGVFVFDDLMPPQWRRPRVDLHRPTVKECRDFGLKRARVWVKG